MSQDFSNPPACRSAAARRRQRREPGTGRAVGGATLLLGGCMRVAQRAGWSLDAPQVVGLGPRSGARDVGGKEPVVVSFNMPMDQAAAQAALKVDPPTEGEFAWDGPTMIWTPKVGYQRGTTYTVELVAGQLVVEREPLALVADLDQAAVEVDPAEPVGRGRGAGATRRTPAGAG